MRCPRRLCIMLANALTLAIAGSCFSQVQPTVADVPYAFVGGQPLLLDLYLPPDEGPSRPIVVTIHGGAWAGGDKYPPPGFTGQLLNHGIAVASVNYRLTTEDDEWGGAPVIFPAQIHDVKAAVRWLRGNAATYNLDPGRFGSWGSSAGGHLSALLGTSAGVTAAEGTLGSYLSYSSAVQLCADFFGPTDLLMMDLDVTTPPGSTIDHDAPSSPESHLLGWDGPGQGVGDIRKNIENPNPPYPALVALANLANPITHVDGAEPPFFIAHGTADTVVPLNQSTRLADALSAARVEHTYVQAVGYGHGFLGPTVNQQLIAFFTEQFDRLPTLPPGDLSADSVVNGIDLALLLGQWTGGVGYSPCPPFKNADLNDDCRVNGLDLALLLGQWTV